MILAAAEAAGRGTFDGGNLWGVALRLLLALALVLPLAYVSARLYARRAASAAGRFISVVDAVALGPNRALYLVEAGGRLLVLGVTPQQVNLLAELADPELLEKVKEQAGSRQRPRFAQALSDSLVRLRKEKREDDAE